MKKLRGSLWVILGVLASLAVRRAECAQQNYTGADAGLWNTAANWTLNGGSTHVVPVNGDDAVLGLGSGGAIGVTFNATYTGAGLNSLTLDSPNRTSITLNQTSASTMIATTEYIGVTVGGNTYNQSAGTNTVTTLAFGAGNGGLGNYTLSGTGVLNSTSVFIGYGGTGAGSFAQSGGTHNVANSLDVGYIGTSTSNSYNLTGGTLAFGNSASLNVGMGEKGTFTQSAGAVTFSGSSGYIYIGGSSVNTAANLYTLSGTGTITGASLVLDVGDGGNGTFTQTGGTVTLGTGNFIVGDGASGVGTYNLSATTGTGALNVANATVGNSGTGTFTQAGGTLTVSGNLNLALNAGSNGTFTLSSGAVNVTGDASIGAFGTGIFNQSGGTFSSLGIFVGTGLNVANPGNGTLNLSGGTATAATLYAGYNAGGTGQINQTGGTLNVTNIASLGTYAGGIGGYTMDTSVGASALNATTLTVGDRGTGTFTQNAGTVTISGTLNVGNNAGSVGIYNLNGGALTLTGTSYTLIIGGSGSSGSTATGTFNQSGGVVSLTGTDTGMLIGQDNPGTYNLSGGSVTAGTVKIGDLASGSMVQTGGAATMSGMNVGVNYNGTYSLSGAAGVTLVESLSLVIGLNSTGTFTQSGGTHTVSSTLVLGYNTAGTGNYNLSGGTLNVNGNLTVGFAGTGNFNQTGGALVVPNLFVGSDSGSTGTYGISGGTASAGNAYVGYNNGTGTVNQSGGTLTVGTLAVGPTPSNTNSGGYGTFSLSSGTLNVTTSAIVGGSAGGGGVVAGGITPVSGAFNLSGTGTLNAPNSPATGGTGNEFVVGTYGTFTQTGGTVNGYLYNSGQFLFQGGGFGGTLENAAGGTATFNSSVTFGGGLINHGTMNITSGATVGIFQGTTASNDGTITLSAGGGINVGGTPGNFGTFTNNGLITGTGTLGGAGAFVNNLTITQGAGPLTFDFFFPNAVNNGIVTLASGRALNLYGLFTNAGTFAVDGASVLQTGTLANASNGTVTGPGAILSNFTNSGVVTPSGGTLNIVNSWTNNGFAQLGGIADNLAGGTITNNGTIQGFGNVGAPVNNASGVVESTGGTLALGGTLTNPAGGTLAADLGSKLLVTGGLATNAGLITLTGGTFDNNNHALTNTGQISGFGIVRTGGAGLTNAGSITFTGGNTTVNGNVTNNAGQTIRISYNPATFTGNVVNNGTFKTTSTTSTFAGSFTNNGIFTSDPATQSFGTLTIGTAGALQGGKGDVFNVSGNLVNNSQQPTLWNTTAAMIAFTGATAHTLTWSASDLGANAIGFTSNYAVGNLVLASGGSLALQSSGTSGSGLYVSTLDLLGGVSQLASITTNGVNIYYDPTVTDNAYLGGQTYALSGGGVVAPAIAGVPEPGSAALLGIGLSLLASRCRRNGSRCRAATRSPKDSDSGCA